MLKKQKMFVLLGLFFLVIKIAILATVYATITLIILLFLSKKTQVNWIKKIMQLKLITWLTTGFLYSIILFCYAFSYWGYAGIGDYFCIPAGNGFVVSSIDAQENSYFEPNRKENYRQVYMNNFIIKNGKVCGEFLGFNSDDCSDCFIVFDTKTEKILQFNSAKKYSIFAAKNGLPQQQNFKSFGDNYQNYWGGIKNLFLP